LPGIAANLIEEFFHSDRVFRSQIISMTIVT
jgi:hypothetical protein